MALEPGHDIGINAKSQLLLDGSIEEAALDAGPTEEFGRAEQPPATAATILFA